MKTSNVIEGLSILDGYMKSGAKVALSANDNKICFPPTDYSITARDISRLLAIGWVQLHMIDDEDFTLSNYDEEGGWELSLS